MTGNGASGTLRVVPLGGLGEIGLNCLVLEYERAAIAIDCGLMFPEPHMLGVDIVIPDFRYLRSLGDSLLGFVLTHGHEDHIGALPFVLREVEVPVFAPPMAAGLVREKLLEHELSGRCRLVEFRPGQPWDLGPFRIDPVHVTHSTVDSVALAVRTPLGVVLHTGDFKLDYTPVDGRPPDLHRLAEYGAEGVLLLLSDSTNVEREGYTPTERAVHAGLDRIFRETTGKVFFSTFSSHIHRLRQAIELSGAYGRRIAVVGRALQESLRIAAELGHLPLAPGAFVDLETAATMEPGRLTILASGSQGEALSALARIAMDDHRLVKMLPGDAVVLSARVIPGNERLVANMVNHMCRRGATIHTERTAPVHVSGHASQEELKTMIRLLRPKYFVPLHGEYRHLVRHGALAREMGLPPENTFVIENGQVLEIRADGAELRDPVPAGRVFVDGKGIGDVGDIVLRDRRHLSRDGIVLAVLAIDQHTGEILSGPELVTRGFVAEENQGVLEEAKALLLEHLRNSGAETRTDSFEMSEEVRKLLRRHFAKTLDRRPVILPLILEM
ncbi:MAG: ribonuclease J [Candidatus Binatia bacterium]|nr:MAG: ribonuclease J [Candidatus Binatia bacterium]